MKNSDLNRLLSQDPMSKDWVGEVVENNDPEIQFRCKVKVYGLFDELEPEAIPWAFPASNLSFSSTENGGYGKGSYPKIGTLVKVRFANGDIYSPEYYSIQNINPTLQTEIQDDYENCQVLAYDEDEDLKVLYTQGAGLKIYLKKSHITINPDSSVTIEHKDSQSIIELVGSACNIVTQATVDITADEEITATAPVCTINGTQTTQLGPLGNFSAVGAEPLWAFLKSLASAVDAKWPPTPGVNASSAVAGEASSTSTNNKVSV